MQSPEDIYTYMQLHSAELGRRILSSYPALHGVDETPSPLLSRMLRAPYGGNPKTRPSPDSSPWNVGCARKYVTVLNGNSKELIVSFSYFQNVIEEAGELQVSEDYWRYLQLRIHQVERQWLERTQASGEGKFNKRLMAPTSGRI